MGGSEKSDRSLSPYSPEDVPEAAMETTNKRAVGRYDVDNQYIGVGVGGKESGENVTDYG